MGFKEIDFIASSVKLLLCLYKVRFGFYLPFMNLLDIDCFKTEENVSTDLKIVVAALQLPSLPVHFVLPLYQLSTIFKAL